MIFTLIIPRFPLSKQNASFEILRNIDSFPFPNIYLTHVFTKWEQYTFSLWHDTIPFPCFVGLIVDDKTLCHSYFRFGPFYSPSSDFVSDDRTKHFWELIRIRFSRKTLPKDLSDTLWVCYISEAAFYSLFQCLSK